MTRYSRTLLAVVATTATLGALVGAASANRLSLSTRTLSATWSSLTFTSSGFATNRCVVTLSGSFHSSTFTKTVGSLVGYITGASIGICSGMTARANTETLPWHLRYASFTGTLPSITSLRFAVVGFSFEILSGFRCRYTSTAASPVTTSFTLGAGGTATAVGVSGGIASSTGGFCPTMVLSGTSVGMTSLTVRLI